MKCCSRSTLGVVIGSLNIVCYIGVSIYFIILLANLKDNKANHGDYIHEYREQLKIETTFLIVVFVVMLLMIILSGLLITGIVKRRHKLMLPWLIVSGIGFVYNVFKFLSSLVSVLSQGFGAFMVVLFLGFLIIGLQALILWAIYTLYRDIRMKNDDGNGQVIREPEVSHPPQTMPYPSQPNYYKPFDSKNVN